MLSHADDAGPKACGTVCHIGWPPSGSLPLMPEVLHWGLRNTVSACCFPRLQAEEKTLQATTAAPSFVL